MFSVRKSSTPIPVNALFSLVVWGGLLYLAEGHGRMHEPPSRMSAWRYGFPTTPDYNDHEMFCGGRSNQWNRQGGKCGVCGDPWQGPRRYEHPDGSMVPNYFMVTRTYTQGQVIHVSIEVTANHLGWFEFRLCDIATTGVGEATQECLDQYILTDPSLTQSQFDIGTTRGFWTQYLKLPEDMTCQNCLLQWKWHCGNSPGLGIEQEEFYACSDVTIEPRSNVFPTAPPSSRNTTTSATTTTTSTTTTTPTTTTTTTTQPTTTTSSTTTPTATTTTPTTTTTTPTTTTTTTTTTQPTSTTSSTTTSTATSTTKQPTTTATTQPSSTTTARSAIPTTPQPPPPAPTTTTSSTTTTTASKYHNNGHHMLNSKPQRGKGDGNGNGNGKGNGNSILDYFLGGRRK